MQKNPKQFADQLNESLDDLGLPTNLRERAVAFSKMLNIPKQQAWGILEGQMLPDKNLMERIIAEFEVS